MQRLGIPLFEKKKKKKLSSREEEKRARRMYPDRGRAPVLLCPAMVVAAGAILSITSVHTAFQVR
jgi:hypothetical protein